ncbi:MAG: PAS domain-containing protein, partial [Candidatus Saccharimonadales bacterium]
MAGVKSDGVGSNDSADKSANKYINALADSSSVGLWVTDKTGGLIYANKTLTTWAGHPLKELLEKGWHTSLGQDYEHKKENEVASVILELKDYHAEFQFWDKTGNTRWLDVSGRPYFDQNGKFAGYSGVAVDITDTKRSLEESTAGVSRQAAFFSAALNGVIIMDAEGVITEFNPSAERMFGYK